LELKNHFSAFSHSSEMDVESAWKEVEDSYLNTSEKHLVLETDYRRSG
jgi:hypothetical protein